ncbi:uncharacterized protein LOC116289880 [Actinia tenebrosa]|uniref:Uncharacterized protein LOC116289880 n=1 Tax=Actinia tenebrosa TaxID=6105 RepID=A0A6P8HJ23_ACTTE|nr:uncharacterized protein LOC116289880 [Actinia tenebrosa]XP_031552678.1 uncharacterized protein LOC116289880 [Actinia tenebrosa]
MRANMFTQNNASAEVKSKTSNEKTLGILTRIKNEGSSCIQASSIIQWSLKKLMKSPQDLKTTDCASPFCCLSLHWQNLFFNELLKLQTPLYQNVKNGLVSLKELNEKSAMALIIYCCWTSCSFSSLITYNKNFPWITENH